MRHSLDHFTCIVKSAEYMKLHGLVTIAKYDERKRITDVETDVNAALKAINQVISKINV